MLENNKSGSLNIKEQNRLILSIFFGITFLTISKIFLQKINISSSLEYSILISISLIAIFSFFKFFLINKIYTNINLAIMLHLLCWVFFIFFIFLIDYSIFYKWDPTASNIYKSIETYFLAFVLLIIIYFYKYLIKNKIINNFFEIIFLLSIFLFSLYFASYQIINDYHLYYMNAIHMDVVIYPIVQVFLGKTLLVNAVAQYGLYAHFMEPVLKLTGLSLVSITGIFGVILFFALFIFGFGIFKILNNKLISIIGFSIFLYSVFITFMLYPYQLLYQTYAIRLIFPAYAFLASIYYFKNPQLKILLIHVFILTLGILWNIDSGIIVFLSFSSAIIFSIINRAELTLSKKVSLLTVKVAIIVGVFLITMFLFSLFINLRSSEWPNFYDLFVSFDHFAKGKSKPFSLEQVRFIGVIIYISALYYIISISLNNKINDKFYANIIFYLLIFGIGIFFRSYKTGDINGQLYSIYPSLIIILIFFDKHYSFLVQNKDKKYNIKDQFVNYSTKSFLFIILYFLSYVTIYNLYFINKSPLYQNAVRIHEFYPINSNNTKLAWRSGKEGQTNDSYVLMKDLTKDKTLEPPWLERANKLKIFFEKNKLSNNRLAIISMYDGYLYMKLNHPSSLNVINTHHIFMLDHLDKLKQLLIKKKIDYVILDDDPLLINKKYPNKKTSWKDILNVLVTNYNQVKKIKVQPSWNYDKNIWETRHLIIYKKY